jgi:hypothetical protein
MPQMMPMGIRKILTASASIAIGAAIYGSLCAFGFPLLLYTLLPAHIILSILYVVRNYAKGYIVLMMLLVLAALVVFLMSLF